MESITNYTEPRDIYEKIGSNASELSEEEHGFICGLIKKNRPQKILELGVSGGGTSILILNCLQKLKMNDTKMYSVDLSKSYHYNPEKPCGFQIKEARKYLENIDNHTLMLGKILPEVIEEIAKDGKIDFLILDTTHYLPGELMDFAVSIPFLADDAIIVLDDISFWYEGENRWAFSTKILFDLCETSDKCYAYSPDGFAKMVGFRMPSKTNNWQKSIFDALSMPWSYYEEDQVKVYKSIVDKYFSTEIRSSFESAVKINKYALDKKKNIKNIIKDILRKCRDSDTRYLYGAGQRGKALLFFLNSNGILIDGVIVSDNRSINQELDSDVNILHFSDVAINHDCMIIVAAADVEIRDNLDKAGITYYDVPNYVFPFIKDYYEIMK